MVRLWDQRRSAEPSLHAKRVQLYRGASCVSRGSIPAALIRASCGSVKVYGYGGVCVVVCIFFRKLRKALCLRLSMRRVLPILMILPTSRSIEIFNCVSRPRGKFETPWTNTSKKASSPRRKPEKRQYGKPDEVKRNSPRPSATRAALDRWPLSRLLRVSSAT